MPPQKNEGVLSGWSFRRDRKALCPLYWPESKRYPALLTFSHGEQRLTPEDTFERYWLKQRNLHH
jgi:hypothetical protein